MPKVRIGLLLHFFQPYWQFPHVLARIVEECYRPIFRYVRNQKKFAFTANINYSLIELLLANGFEDVVDDIKFCVENGLIELVGTAAYHPILPLIPKDEVEKQIAYDINQKKLAAGISANCRGFFFPEMAFSQGCLPVIRNFGFRWTVAEDVAVPPGWAPKDRILNLEGMAVFLRSSHWSRKIWDEHADFDTFAAKINYELPDWAGDRECYLVIAMDAETFGHHVKGLADHLLFPMIYHWGGSIVRPFEELMLIFPQHKVEYLPDCSWSTGYGDLSAGDPFPLWKSRYNSHHYVFWELLNLAFKYADNPDMIKDCLRMANSCHTWWISRGFWKPSFMRIGAEKAFYVVMKYGTEDEKKTARSCLDALGRL